MDGDVLSFCVFLFSFPKYNDRFDCQTQSTNNNRKTYLFLMGKNLSLLFKIDIRSSKLQQPIKRSHIGRHGFVFADLFFLGGVTVVDG